MHLIDRTSIFLLGVYGDGFLHSCVPEGCLNAVKPILCFPISSLCELCLMVEVIINSSETILKKEGANWLSFQKPVCLNEKDEPDPGTEGNFVPITYYTSFFLTISQVLLLWTLIRYWENAEE